ncbi:hypothetical protein ACTL6U_15640 [Rhodovibrionaceae bacterium A322]
MKTLKRGVGTAILVLAFGLSACGGEQRATTGGASQTGSQNPSQQAGSDMAGKTAPQDQGVTIKVGSALADVVSQLGEASSQKILKNDSPDVMGALVSEYAFEDALVEIRDSQGNSHTIANLLLVTDTQGKIIRLAVNPNPFGPEETRSQRGVTYSVLEAEIPAGVSNRLKHL